MKKHIKIGEREYQSKKDATLHYRHILNSYEFGQSLNESDFSDLIDLLDYENEVDTETENEFEPEPEIKVDMQMEIEFEPEPEIYIEDIKVSEVQFSTKCFEVFFSNKTSCYISYLLLIREIGLETVYHTPERLFSIACRNAVNADIHRVKSLYFKNSIKGLVKCQETGILSKWEELVVDHRQPNTFSIILDRFKELNNIDLDTIEYTSDCKNNIIFLDVSLSEKFRRYHSEKANLRVVRRECNSGRTGMAKVKRTNKDLIILPDFGSGPADEKVTKNNNGDF
jgi:hypothetical protein